MNPIKRYVAHSAELSDDDLAAAYATDRDRSWLRVNFVSSLDGAVTAGDGYSEGLSNPADKRVFGVLRMQCDALLVAAGTLRHEGYGPVRLDERRRAWRVAHGLAEYPTLVVVSRTLDLDPAQAAFAEAPVRPVVVTVDSSPVERRAALAPVADVLVHGDTDVDLRAALDVLDRCGLRQVLCEGGPQLLAALTRDDLVDELCLTATPLLVGPGPGRITAGAVSPQPRHLRLAHVLAAGDMLLLRYLR